jgi:hypothetical protein
MRKFTKAFVPLAAALIIVGTLALSGAAATGTSVGLGTAGSFVVLAGAGVTNTGPTTLNGDIGTFPTTSETGTGSLTITGTDHAGDSVTQQAKNDLVTAFNTAAGEGPTSPITADLGSQTLLPGVYNSAGSVGLTGNLTLNGVGNPDAVFVFQAGSTLTTATASSVTLENGAQACNVFWEIGSSATLGTSTAFQGTLIAQTSITLTTRATVIGRMLARDGAVTLDTNTITAPSCATPTPPDTTPATTTTDTTTTATTTASTPTATTPTATTPAATTAPATALTLANARFVAAKKAAAKKLAAKVTAKKAATKQLATKVAAKPAVKAPVVKAPVAKVPVVRVPVVKAPVVKVPPVKKAPHTLHPKPPVHRFGITG